MQPAELQRGFFVSIANFKSSSTQQEVQFVKNGPILSEMNNKAAYALWQGYLDKSLPLQPVTFWSPKNASTMRLKATLKGQSHRDATLEMPASTTIVFLWYSAPLLHHKSHF